MKDILLLCATDSGGARNLKPLVDLIQSEGFNYALVASGVSLPILYSQNAKIEKPEILTLTDAINYLVLKKPNVVICGIAGFSSPDRFLVAAAKKLKIKSAVILDEWFYYRKVFEDENGEAIYLPDIICCQDEKARQEAIAEGIPAELLFVTGSASLSILTDLAEDFLVNPPAVPDFMNDKEKPIVTFLSEPFSACYGSKASEKGRLGDFLGYSEQTIREDVFAALERIGKPCTVVEKLHPSSKNIYKSLGNDFIRWISVCGTETWPVLWHSDLVIGMRSIALLEASILGCEAVSYQPNLIGPQLCTAVRLELIENIYDFDRLKHWITQRFSTKLKVQNKMVKRFPFARKDAVQNIFDSILKN